MQLETTQNPPSQKKTYFQKVSSNKMADILNYEEEGARFRTYDTVFRWMEFKNFSDKAKIRRLEVWVTLANAP
jgi:hypothetical protein